MNGRIYDPTLGRFLQADPYIQAPSNSQSYNRYSYVFNNPLKYTDPSGYSAWTNFRDKVLKPVAAIAISVWSGGIAAGYGLSWAGFGVAAAGGAAAGYVATGSLKGALTGAFSAAAFFGVGQYFQGLSNTNAAYARKIGNLAGSAGFDAATHTQLTLDTFVNFGGNYLSAGQVAGQIASHAALGGVIADLVGGKFGHGFFAAGITKGLGTPLNQVAGNNVVAGTISSSILGGTVSKFTGGKFANGASTAAFQTIFNGYSRKMTRENAVRGGILNALSTYDANMQLENRVLSLSIASYVLKIGGSDDFVYDEWVTAAGALGYSTQSVTTASISSPHESFCFVCDVATDWLYVNHGGGGFNAFNVAEHNNIHSIYLINSTSRSVVHHTYNQGNRKWTSQPYEL
jgi:hypothetical protein